MKGPPFEPLHETSLQAITLKTIFLVALTSARRCSELQALSRNAPCTRFESTGVRLRTVVSFLPKTANPAHLGQDIFLPVNNREPELCVVRLLKRYIKLTMLNMKDCLFVMGTIINASLSKFAQFPVG